MKKDYKKILTINDISCIGKCSITAIHPILSSCGFETIILPTSLLSNHTAYKEYSFLDLTDEMNIIINKWKNLNIKFDSIVSGYLGSEEQINIVKKTKKSFLKENGLFVVDPVMGDNGNIYKGFDINTYPNKIKAIVKDADIITPNITEACLLLNIKYKEEFSLDEINDITKKLNLLGPKKIIITGIINNGKIGVFYYDTIKNENGFYFTKIINKIFHGTGDTFTAAVVGAILNDKSLKDATKIAIDFTYTSILEAVKINSNPLNGLPFEKKIKYLINKIK